MDALPAVKKFVNAAASTQGKPMGHVHNYGGFTDGDRCVFLADFLGAAENHTMMEWIYYLEAV